MKRGADFSVQTVHLICHPTTTTQAVQGIEVRVGWSQDDTLTLSYTLTGDCPRLQIPETRPQAQVDGLWQHTCFEAFLSSHSDTVYWEFNFSPSSEWAAYQFHRYRERVSDGVTIAPPQLVTHQTADRLTLDVGVRVPHLLAIPSLRVGLSAVIEDDQGQRSYWALAHPSEKPDFHHAAAFVLEIPPLMMTTTGKEPQ